MLWSYTMSVPRAADVEKAISWAKRPRPGAPREAWTGVLTIRRPDESTSRAMNAPSNTLAVPVRVNGLATTAPTPGDSTKIGGSKSRQSARVWAPSSTTPSPPSASTGSPSSRNSTERTVG